MIKVKETTNRSVTVNKVYMSGENLLLDESGDKVDLYGLIRKTYGDGTDIEIKITHKSDEDINS